MSIKALRLLLNTSVVFSVFTLTSCGGSSSSSLGSSPTTPQATSMWIQDNVFTPSCAISGCHTATDHAGNLVLSAGAAFDSVAVTGLLNGTTRVKPGDASNSLLVQRLEGTTGTQMPSGAPALDQTTIDAIRLWIDDGAVLPTLTSIQSQVFTPTCATTGCHDTTTASGSLDLTLNSSFTSLVGINIASGDTTAVLRVEAGNADNSYLIQKLEGTHTVGDQMPPPPSAPLHQGIIDTIRKWIDDGALNN